MSQTNFLLTPPIIVFGMHRSGTSLLANVLSKIGVHLGNDLVGHHESFCFQNINNELLSLKGSHWARPEPFVTAIKTEEFVKQCQSHIMASISTQIMSYGKPNEFGFWGWKDPRNTLTLPIWLQRFPDATLLYIYRNGIDVALSVYRREIRYLLKNRGEKRLFPPSIGASYKLWEAYMKIGNQLAKQHKKCFTLSYEDLLSDSVNQIKGIAKFIGIEFDEQRVNQLAQEIIRKPTQRSRLDSFRIQLFSRMGFINLDSLEGYGYEAFSQDINTIIQ